MRKGRTLRIYQYYVRIFKTILHLPAPFENVIQMCQSPKCVKVKEEAEEEEGEEVEGEEERGGIRRMKNNNNSSSNNCSKPKLLKFYCAFEPPRTFLIILIAHFDSLGVGWDLKFNKFKVLLLSNIYYIKYL